MDAQEIYKSIVIARLKHHPKITAHPSPPSSEIIVLKDGERIQRPDLFCGLQRILRGRCGRLCLARFP